MNGVFAREAWTMPNRRARTSSPAARRRRGQKRQKAKESGWNARTGVQSGIPQYNSLNDVNCPYTHTAKFASTFAKRLSHEQQGNRASKNRNNPKGKKRSKSKAHAFRHSKSGMDLNTMAGGRGAAVYSAPSADHLSRTAPGFLGEPNYDKLDHAKRSARSVNSSNTTRDGNGKPNAHHSKGVGAVMNTSTPHGGITFQQASSSHSSDPSTEMEVLKNIILREGYLEKLRFIFKKEKERTLLRHEVVDLLDLLRVSTVETVEAIAKWRRTLLRPYPFVWNGVNYLLKISSDIDFLDRKKGPSGVKHEPAKTLLSEWLGFGLSRNPFIVPITLDERPDTPRVVQTHAERNIAAVNQSATRSTGKLIVTPGKSTENSGMLTGTLMGIDGFHEIGAESTGGKNINLLKHVLDDRMVHIKRSESKGESVGATLSRESSGTAYATPIINDKEMLDPRLARVRKATPSAHGRDVSAVTPANLLPSHIGDLDMLRIREAEKVILQEEAIHGRMVRDEFNRLVPEALRKKLDAELEALDGKQGQSMKSSGPKGRRRRSTRKKSAVSAALSQDLGDDDMSARSTKGHLRARKEGGLLTPLTRRGTGGKRALTHKHRSRTARMDMDIRKAKLENERLASEVERLKLELAQEEADLEAIMGQTSADDAARQIQASFRGKQGRDAVRARREALVRQKEELVLKEQELVHRRTELARKEEVRDSHKRQRHLEQKRHREALIERKVQERNGGVPAEVASQSVAMSIEDQSAIQIQRVGRGRLGKNRWKRRYMEFSASALQSQSLVRAFFARRRVKGMVRMKKGSSLIQRVVRGLIARRRVKHRRRINLENLSCTRIQSFVRAHRGRRRMQAKRDLTRVAKEAKAAVESVFMSDLDELCSIGTGPVEKRQPPLPALLSMLQCVRILWASGCGPPPGSTSAPMRWNRLRRRILRPSFLPRLRSLAQAAVDEVLQLSPARVAAIRVFFNDPELNLKTMLGLPVGAKASQKLYTWLVKVLRANELCKQFLVVDLGAKKDIDGGALHEDARHWQIEERSRVESDSSDDEEVDKVDVKRYVPYEVQKCKIVRPRPLLIGVSRDTPKFAKRLIIRKLMEQLPGVFTRIDTPKLDVVAIQVGTILVARHNLFV